MQFWLNVTLALCGTFVAVNRYLEYCIAPRLLSMLSGRRSSSFVALFLLFILAEPNKKACAFTIPLFLFLFLDHGADSRSNYAIHIDQQ